MHGLWRRPLLLLVHTPPKQTVILTLAHRFRATVRKPAAPPPKPGQTERSPFGSSCPTAPETTTGYIEAVDAGLPSTAAYATSGAIPRRWCRSPALLSNPDAEPRPKQFLSTGRFTWNSGMFY